MADGLRVVAVDWSGRATGAASYLWLAEARQGDGYSRVDHASLRISLIELSHCLRRLGKEDEARQLEREATSLPESAYASVVQPVLRYAHR